jgi:hypothetical protein
MPETVMRAPRFEVVLTSGIDKAAEAVFVTFGSADKKKFQLDFSLKCVPLAIAALGAEGSKLAATYPVGRTPDLQGIRMSGTQLAMKDDGTVTLLLRLQSGAELPLEFQQKDLTRLRAQIDEAVQLADKKGHH